MKAIISIVLGGLLASPVFGKMGNVDDIVARYSGKVIGYTTTAGGGFLNRGVLKELMTYADIVAFERNATSKQVELLDVLLDRGSESDIQAVDLTKLTYEQHAIINTYADIDDVLAPVFAHLLPFLLVDGEISSP